MYAAKCPPVAQEVTIFVGGFSGFEVVREIPVVMEELFAQCLQHARHRDNGVDTLFPCNLNDLRRLERLEEVDFAAHDLGNEDAHQLSKHVTQRQQAEKA